MISISYFEHTCTCAVYHVYIDTYNKKNQDFELSFSNLRVDDQ